MDCNQVTERLPWHANGTLPPAEESEVVRHLAVCPRCRRELADTRGALVLFGGHLPAESLISYALGETGGVVPGEIVEGHLAGCERCRDELELVRRSHVELEAAAPADAAAAGRVVLLRRRDAAPSRPLRYAALAASLLLALAVGWLAAGRWSAGPDEVRTAELAGPRANVPVIDLYPDGLVVRGPAAVPEIDAPDDAGEATIILNTSLDDASGVRLEVVDGEARVVARLDGLRLNDAGFFSLSLPLGSLPPGAVTLHLYRPGEEVPAESYPLSRR